MHNLFPEYQQTAARCDPCLTRCKRLSRRNRHAGVSDNRVQNVVITLDKVKLTLSRPEQCRRAPLRLLDSEEVTEYLWTGNWQPLS